MKTKLFRKFRYHYHYYYNHTDKKWMLLSRNKWGHNVPAGLSSTDIHTGILHAIEQIKGIKFTTKLQRKNALKNKKANTAYVRDNGLFLKW